MNFFQKTPHFSLRSSKQIRPKKDLFKNIITLPAWSRYPVIETFQWIDSGGEYKLHFSTFEIKQLFDSPLNISETWDHFLDNLYVLCRNNNLSENNQYDAKLQNSALILLILCILIQNKDKFFELMATKIKNDITSTKKTNNKTDLRKLAKRYTSEMDKGMQMQCIKSLLTIIAYTKLYSGLVLELFIFEDFNKSPVILNNKTKCAEDGMSNSQIQIHKKLQETNICQVKNNRKQSIMLNKLSLADIIDDKNVNIGDCIYFMLVVGRCLNELVLTYQDDINDNISKYGSDYGSDYNNNIRRSFHNDYGTIYFSDILKKKNSAEGYNSIVNVISRLTSSGDINEKVLALYNKIIWLFNIYWGIYNIFVDSVDLQYTKSDTNERISQKSSLVVLKRNSLIKRKLYDYSLSSSVRTITPWQTFALKEPTIKVITFFNQYLLYFLKEDFGYSLLYILGSTKLKKMVEDEGGEDTDHSVLAKNSTVNKLERVYKNEDKLVDALDKAGGITGSTSKLHLLQPENVSLNQIQLAYYFNIHKNGVNNPQEAAKKNKTGTKVSTFVLQKIERNVLESLIKPFFKNNNKDTPELNKKILIDFLKISGIKDAGGMKIKDTELGKLASSLLAKEANLQKLTNALKYNNKQNKDNKNQEIQQLVDALKQSSGSLRKYGYVMSIFTNIIEATIVNPEIMCCDSSSNTFKYYEIEETRHRGDTNDDDDEVEDDDDKKRLKKKSEILAILDNGFIVLMKKVFAPSQYVIVGIVAQMVKSTENETPTLEYIGKEVIADTEFILYKPYVPFDLESSDEERNPDLHNTKICTYGFQANRGGVKERNIKFETFLPYDFELANLLVRVLINFGIKIGGGQFGPEFKVTPSIIPIANNVLKQSLIDVFR